MSNNSNSSNLFVKLSNSNGTAAAATMAVVSKQLPYRSSSASSSSSTPVPPPRTTILPVPTQVLTNNNNNEQQQSLRIHTTPTSSSSSTASSNLQPQQRSLVISTSSISPSVSTNMSNQTSTASISLKIASSPLHQPNKSIRQSSLGNNSSSNSSTPIPVSMTTEEEFKKMENAVTSLLISKKQIDSLKSERNTLIKFYESKLNEQNDQIRFLNDENSRLKSIVSSLNLKLNNKEFVDLTNNNSEFCCKCDGANNQNNKNNSNEKQDLLRKYELTIDNVIRQLLNTLKLNDTAIKHSYIMNQASSSKQQQRASGSLSSEASSKSSVSSLIINDTTVNSNPNASSQFSNDSLETRKMKSKSKRRNDEMCNDQFVKASSSWVFNQKISNETLTYLLIEQKKQQLNLLTELSLISQNLKGFEADSKLKDNSNDESISLSSLKSLSSSQSTTNTNSELITNIINLMPPSPVAPLSQPNNVCYFMMQNADEMLVADESTSKPVSNNTNNNYSLKIENKLFNTSFNENNASNPMMTSNNSSKPSKIPKYKRNGSISSTNSSSSNCYNMTTNQETTIRFKNNNSTTISKIPQRQARSLSKGGQSNPIRSIKNDEFPIAASETTTSNKLLNNNSKSLINKNNNINNKQLENSNSSLNSSTANARSKSNSNTYVSSISTQVNSASNYSTYIKNKSAMPNKPATKMQQQKSAAKESTKSIVSNSNQIIDSTTFDKLSTIAPSQQQKTTTYKVETKLENSATLLIKSVPTDCVFSSSANDANYNMAMIISNGSQDTSSTASDKNNDSGIRISTTSAESSNNTGSSGSSSSSSTSSNEDSASSSQNHSPHLKSVTVSNVASPIQQSTHVMAAVVASAITRMQSNQQLLVRSSSSIESNLQPSAVVQALANTKRRIKKRYCFPTLKSFSYYYNNRFYHKFHSDNSSSSSKRNSASLCCKYLSESDVAALANQLSSYDKDLSYNVYHLDTLYNNVDYILFNSYASDTELVYNYNRRHGRNQHFLNSNYKLYINDYFNQAYDDDGEEEDDSQINESQKEVDASKIIPNDQNNDNSDPCMNKHCHGVDETSLAEYELNEDDQMKIAEQYDNLMNTSNEEINGAYCYAYDSCCNTSHNNNINYEYQYDDYEDDEEINNNPYNGSGLAIGGDCFSTGDIEGLLFDDDDVNLLLIMNEVNNQQAKKQQQQLQLQLQMQQQAQQQNVAVQDVFDPNLFQGISDVNSVVFTSPSLSSLTSSSSSSSTTSNDSSNESNSSSSSSDSTSNDDDDDSFKKFKRVKSAKKSAQKDDSSHHKRSSRHHHRHSRRHDYFLNEEIDIDDVVDKEIAYSAIVNENKNEFVYLPNVSNNHSDDNDFIQDKFDIDEFVQQLNLQCNIDNRISECRKSARKLREMNRIAAAQLVKAAAQQDTSSMIYDQENDTKFENISSPVHHIIRRHTITAIPSKAVQSTFNEYVANNGAQISSATSRYNSPLPTINSLEKLKVIDNNHSIRATSVMPNVKLVNKNITDTKAFAGSLTMPSTPVHTNRYSSKAAYAGTCLDSRADTPSFHNTTTLPAIAASTSLINNLGMKSSNTTNSLICGSYNNAAGTAMNAPNGYEFSPCKINFNDFNNDFYRLCSDTFYCGSETNIAPHSQPANAIIQTVSSSQTSLNHQNDMIDYDELMTNSDIRMNPDESNRQIASYQTNISAHVNTLFDQWLMQNTSTPSTPIKQTPTPSKQQKQQQQPSTSAIAGSVINYTTSTFRPNFNNYSSNNK